MAETLCINLSNMGSNTDQSKIDEGDETPVLTLTDIVPGDATASEAVDVLSDAVPAVGEMDTEGYVPAIDGQSATLTTFTKDLDSSSDAIPLPGESFDGYGQFTNYAVQQLYQDISTAFTQRTLVGLELKADAAGEPDAALNHYLTVAIVSFINRVNISVDDSEPPAVTVQSLDAAGE